MGWNKDGIWDGGFCDTCREYECVCGIDHEGDM